MTSPAANNVMVDVLCRYCSERITELGPEEAFDALAAHECADVYFFHNTVAGRMAQWVRVTP